VIAGRCSDLVSVLRLILLGAVLLTVSCTTAGCAVRHDADAPTAEEGDPLPGADAAQRRMIAVVDETTATLGGTWTVTQGADHIDSCTLPGGGAGASWVYLVKRSDGDTDPEGDASTVARAWRSAGMSVQTVTDPDGPVVVARDGGSVALVDLYAFPGRYSVEAVSLCFPGDPDQIEEQQVDE